MRRFALVAFLALFASPMAPQPSHAQIGAELGNPGPAQWKKSVVPVNPRRGGTGHGPLLSQFTGRFEDRYHFDCDKPACPVRTTVFFKALTTRGRALDAEARRAFLAEHEAAMAGSKWDFVKPMKEGRFRGQPAYSGAWKRFAMGVTEYAHHRIVFSGDTAVTISGNASESAVARRGLDLFLPHLRFGAPQ